jgi:uncharacterized protein YjiS (DUF1127 family)
MVVHTATCHRPGRPSSPAARYKALKIREYFNYDRNSKIMEAIMSLFLPERRRSIPAAHIRGRVAARCASARAAAHAPAAMPDLPVAPPRALWWQILGSLIVATLREWRRRRASRRELAYLDERTLRDIGLDPGIVDYELRQPFWRPPRNWRD